MKSGNLSYTVDPALILRDLDKLAQLQDLEEIKVGIEIMSEYYQECLEARREYQRKYAKRFKRVRK